MNHLGTVTIETDRLLLRRFTEQDTAAIFKNWTSDEKTTEFLRWPAHKTIDITRTVLKEWLSSYQKNDYYQWAIVLKEEGPEPIGIISAVEINEKLNLISIGYCIGRNWWHQGITSEAFMSIIPFFFNEVKVNRIEAQHDPNNPNSGKVMEKCGLQYEGTLRQADFSNKGIIDTKIYSLLARDYYEKN